MKTIILSCLICISTFALNAQAPNKPKTSRQNQANPKHIIQGTIVDDQSKSPLEYATVSVFKKDKLISGTITDEQGQFKLNVRPGTYRLEIEFLAYASSKLDGIIIGEETITNLGEILLNPDSETLDEVEIIGSKSQVQLSLDKKIYNVGKDINSRAGAADDVLDNLPAVNVDIDGNVSLRGSENVRILIDGRPSGASGVRGVNVLKSIPSNQIDRVEIITNPSARYEAEGSAGIINIVLKKNKKSGLNGSFDISSGVPLMAGVGINLNYRKNKINWFTSVGGRYRSSLGRGFRNRLFTDSRSPVRDTQERDMERGGWASNLKFGLTYFIDKKNTITTSFRGNKADEDNETILTFKDYNASESVVAHDIRTDDESEDEKQIEYNLLFKHIFDTEKHVLSADFSYTDQSEVEFSNFSEQSFNLDGSKNGSPQQQQNTIDEGEQVYIFKSDYNYPISKEGKFELGYRGSFRDVTNNFRVDTLVNGVFQVMPEFENNLLYTENIHAAYATVGNKINRFSFLAGLRVEYSDILTELKLTQEINPRSYTDYFPSAFFTYELNEKHAIQTSYSRRIRRPRFFELNPFITFSNNRNLFKGNPNLNPEYTDSYEVGHIAYLSKITVTSALYYRHTTGAIRRLFVQNPDRSSTITPQNIGVENSYGLDLTLSADITPWWKFSSDFNLFAFDLSGAFDQEIFDVQDVSYRGRISNKLSISKKYDLQLTSRYRGGSETAQGSRKGVFALDIGASTDVLGGKGTITLNARDVFNSRKRRSQTIGENFIIDGEFQWMSRQTSLTFSYRLNQRKQPNRGNRGPGGGDGGNGGF